jgi:DamX protein
VNTPKQLLEALAVEFDTDPGGRDYERGVLNLLARWEAIRDSNRVPVLCVDDAHLLSNDLLRTLLIFHRLNQTDLDNGPLSVILLSEELLEKRFSHCESDWNPKRALLELTLPPLTEDDASAYLQHRLHRCGVKGRFPFSDKELRGLMHQSAGLPGRLDQLANELLARKARRFGWLRHLRARPTIIPTASAMMISAAILVAAMMRSEAPTEHLSTRLGLGAAPAAPAAVEPVDCEASPRRGASCTEAPAGSAGKPSEPGPSTSFLERHRPNMALPIDDRQPGSLSPVVLNSARSTASGAPEAQTRPRPQAKPPHFASIVPSTLRGWIASRDPSHWTVQLIATSTEAAARAFIRRHGLDERGGYFRSRRATGSWYSVIAGDYATKQAAARARARLPRSLTTNRPWIRRFSAIHRSLDWARTNR